jgi:hypothetical protein
MQGLGPSENVFTKFCRQRGNNSIFQNNVNTGPFFLFIYLTILSGTQTVWRRMISDNELQTIWKEAAVAQFKVPHRKFLERLRMAVKEAPMAHSRAPCQDLNPGHPE